MGGFSDFNIKHPSLPDLLEQALSCGNHPSWHFCLELTLPANSPRNCLCTPRPSGAPVEAQESRGSSVFTILL